MECDHYVTMSFCHDVTTWACDGHYIQIKPFPSWGWHPKWPGPESDCCQVSAARHRSLLVPDDSTLAKSLIPPATKITPWRRTSGTLSSNQGKTLLGNVVFHLSLPISTCLFGVLDPRHNITESSVEFQYCTAHCGTALCDALH